MNNTGCVGPSSVAAGWKTRAERARDRVLREVQPVQNLAAPQISYQSQGRTLILGPEHRVLLAADRLRERLPVTALVTEAMPSQPDALMEQAAQLAEPVALQRLVLLSIKGFLGHFQVEVEVQGRAESLAALEGMACFDTVLDLGTSPRIETELLPPGYFHAPDAERLARALDELPELVGEFHKPRYFQQVTDQCAHSRNGMTGCTRCLEVCPADAIQVVEGAIQIDSQRCHGAGGCASSCPTGAIRYAHPQPEQTQALLRERLVGYRDLGGALPVVLLHDSFDGAAQMAAWRDRWPANLLPLQIEELGAAGLELWLAALAWGACRVVLLDSEQVTPTVRRVLEGQLEQAGRLLAPLGQEGRICWLDSRAGAWQETLTPLCAPSDLLTTEPVAKEPAAFAPVSDKRELISLALDALYGEQAGAAGRIALATGSPYGQVRVEAERCTLCMGCVSSCPQSALRDGQGEPALRFREQDCIQCGLCVQACPEQAIRLQAGYLVDSEARKQVRDLKRESPFHCIRCNQPFGTQGMVRRMLDQLAGHSMFQGVARERLKMCGDCRVIDLVQQDAAGAGPEAVLMDYVQGDRTAAVERTEAGRGDGVVQIQEANV